MNLSYFFILLLTILTSAAVARNRRRRLLLNRQSSYNKFMRKTSLNYEKAKVETLGAIFKRHVQQLRHTPNKQVELVFLIDSSGSVGSHYFYEEVRFVKNLLADFTVDVNSTRVSVITFSSPHKIFRYIDYLSQPSPENHKCRLLQDDIPDVDYAAGGTHTLGAFLEAEKVLRSARADATKAIFLMTDGYSNGGDPRPVAHKLKAQGVRIFTFGIRDGFVWELQDMASDPKNETCYILDSFEEFEALAKRALHTDLQTGTYVSQSISKCGKLCNNGGACCHQNASCSCGTYTGKYKCLCKPGYFGTGLGKTGCKPCPPGTYKNYTGSGTCTPCPDENQMTPVGSDSLSMCKCKKGYRNSGSQECTVFRCSKLSPPNDGFFVNNKCNNVFNAACGLKCKSGYELHGSSLRICQEDGQWSGQPAECIMKTCPSLPQPKNGHMICTTDDFSYSTVCRFTCNTGYQLVGSRKRTCLAIAFWTGIATRCRAITCPPLVEIKDGTVEPLSCLSTEVVFGTTCKVSCQSGYKLKGPHTKQCTPDGTWMASEEGANMCVDESPPLMHCPRDIEFPADEQDSLTAVFWTAPVPIDNSGLRPVLTSEPALSSGSKFPIGKTTVTYRAKDLSNNVAECHFVVHVIDKTVPRIDKCVSPPPAVSQTGEPIAVKFGEPQFSDNSGKPVEVAPSRRLRDPFPIGETKIVFTAFDSSNNINTCVVDINVVPHLCMTPEAPANGNITCNEGKTGVTCQLSCNDGFTFADEAVTEYSCQFEEGVWMPNDHYPFQDCSAVQSPNDVITPASITLTSDVSCQDKRMLAEIAKNLEEEMKNKLTRACENELDCRLGDLSFICEDDEGFNRVPQIARERKRRAVDDGRKTKLSLSFSLSGTDQNQNGYNENIEKTLTSTLQKLLSSMKDMESETLDVKGRPLPINEMTYDIHDPEYRCDPGSILSNKTCVSCPAGTFCNVDQTKCGKCPKGTYQDKENQMKCIRCPNDQSTDADSCKNVKDCKALCKPGTFSPSGLEPCETCHQGFYSSDYASRNCHSCGEGRTTSRRGSMYGDDCRDLCPSGHASLTGLSPCYPCPLHTYQPKVGQMECFKCPGNGRTNETGVIYMSHCVRSADSWEMQSDDTIEDLTFSFNRCAYDNPCKNGGICEDRGGILFSCSCAPGFAGDTCEDTEDPCKGSPCLNGGACSPAPNGEFSCQCVDGFSGKLCEENIDDCKSNPCENNGVCLDWINSFTCTCQPGFTGPTCTALLESCDNNPCLNGGSCSMDGFDYKCSCAEGFGGDLCDQDIDECLSLPCQNDATCVDLPGSYRCDCIVGYVGDNCEENFDDCFYNPCENEGQCVDGVGDYSCNCPAGFTGKRCEEVLDPYYQLDFDDPNILDYAQLTIEDPLTAVTASFWMKTTDDDNQGTPFSYAVRDEPDAFTITDYRNLNIYINGEDVSADQRLNDGNWQHVVFTWSSPRGEWKLYVNRVLLDQGYDLSTKRAIPAKGIFIIGQEQDEEGGGFSAGETFLGSLTQLNVWDRELSLQEIDDLRYACGGLEGNVIAWTKVQTAFRGGLTKSPSAFCDDCAKPVAPQHGSVTFTGFRPNDDVVYTCDNGYITAGRSEFKCLVSGEWETEPPFCEPVACGHPGSPYNGYIVGRVFSYGSRVRFQCNRGYELDGPESLYCDEYGFWDDDIPDCVEIQCEIPLLSTNTVPSVSTRLVSPGTTVTFSCTPGNKLLSAHDSSTCQIDGTFDKSVPTCDPERCSTPPIIGNGEPKELKVDYGVGETVQYQCLYGYRFSLDSGNRRGSLNCLPSGGWEDNLPICEEILCPDPPFLLNAVAVGDDRWVDAEVTYQCDAGYESVGRNAITCLDTQDWTRLRMRCRPVECGAPPQIPYGSFAGDSFTFESSVQYQCDTGYVMKGTGQLTCGADKLWRGERPGCESISCGPPENIDNGRVNYGTFTFGDVADYTCNPGYTISGSTSRLVCEANGLWTPGLPECLPQTCPVPPDVPNAVYESPSDLVFGATVRYRCNVGHRMLGSSDMVCNERAEWGPALPVCEKVICPKPIAPESGSVKANELSYASVASYSCDPGYRLIGVDGRTCQADGTWSDELPTCQATTCQPGDLDNGIVDYKDLSVGSIVSYSCNKGYKLEGDSIRRCQADLTYDGVAPVCNAVDCGVLLPMENGYISYSSTSTVFDTTATFYCDTGYYLDGTDNVYCGPDGQWSGSTSECRIVSCPKVSKIIPNGRVLGSSFDYASVLTYECDEGYGVVGPGSRTCLEDGTWDKPASTCQLITCPPLRIAYGFLSTLDNTAGTVVRYSCQTHYGIEGSSERTCLEDGSWSGSDPRCVRIRCNAPPDVDHARTVVLSETSIEYSCKKGFDLIGDSVRVCERDDIWTPEAPRCVPAFCEDLSGVVVENGQVIFSSAKVGQTVEYACNPGYKLSGAESRRCLKSGLWEGEEPKCGKIDCGHPGVVPNGHVVGHDYTYGSTVKFECNVGYIQKGATSIRCEESGYWENLYSNCERVFCPELPRRIENGRIYSDSNAYLSLADYVCSKGFILQGVGQRECTDTGEWSGTEPACIPVVCPTPEIVEHGIMRGEKATFGYGDQIFYDCEVGYYLHGKDSRRCTKDATWTEWIPVCYSVQCPEPPPIENGDFVGASAKYKSVLSYYCFEGYQLVGDDEVTCEADGQWSGIGTKCERISCGVPPTIDNAYPDQTTILFFDTIIQYTCNDGFSPSGNDLARCLSNATWSYIDFSCTIITCPPILASDIPNGIFNAPSFNYGVSVEFTCEEGYTLYGESVSECTTTGSWSTTLPRCNIIKCPSVGDVDNGSVTVDNVDYGSIATVKCKLGYVLKGASSFTCLSSGLWSDPLPLCEILVCPPPPAIVNGNVLNSDAPHVFDTSFEYACDFGYELQGPNVLRCTEFGIYDKLFAPTCKRILCPEVEDFSFGQYNWENDTFVLYECFSGFNLVGEALRECVLGGVWGSPAPTCQPVPCPSPPGIDNGNVIGSKYSFGEFVEYRCNKGHNLIGSPISVCTEEGTWSEKKAQCLPVSCDEPGSFDNGYIVGDINTYLNSIEYVCSPGFELDGTNSRTCQEDGAWSLKPPTCLRMSCQQPDPIGNGAFFGDSYLFESVISYNCSVGYTLVGEFTRICENTLEWSGVSPSCDRISCPPPEDVLNGLIDGNSYLYEDSITITCNRGYKLEGSESRICQADKSWSGGATICNKIYCPVPPLTLLNGFNDYEVGNMYGVDDTLTYFCSTGYMMNGNGQRTCEASGQWSSNALQCYAVSCPDVIDITNGAFTSDLPDSPFSYPSSLSFTCNEGFTLVGSSTAECESSGAWSEAIPVCSIIACENLAIENGFTQLLPDNALKVNFVRDDGKLYAGDSVLIQCNTGYELKGTSETSCSFVGKWAAGYGSCERIRCPEQAVENGIVSGLSFLYKDEIQISCNRGYQLEGSVSRRCQADASWSGAESVCTKVHCPVPPPTLLNGFRDYEIGNLYGVDDFVTYFCNEGYTMNGSGQKTCEATGQWSANVLQCYAVSCPDVTGITNGGFNSDSPESPYTYPSSLFFTCNEGFNLIGSSTVQCRSSGTWSEAIPVCSVIECKNLLIANGLIQLLPDSDLKADIARVDGQLYAGDHVLIQCDTGYEISGISNTSCSLRGRWKSGYGSCQRIQCPQPFMENGIISGSSFLYQDEIDISCNRGYTLEGSGTRVCQADESWSGADSVCIRIYCRVPPPTLENSVSDYELGKLYGVDDTLTYQCNEGHLMNGTGQMICELSGEWSLTYLECYPISCQEVASFKNGVFSSDNLESPFTFPSTLSFKCDSGFRLVGAPSVTCGSAGLWSDALPFCSIIECETLQLEDGVPQLLTDAGLTEKFVRDDGRYYAGDRVLIQCDSGYEISGENSTICSLEGVWSTESYCNPIVCMAPDIKGAQFSDVSTIFEDIIEVSCNEGLDLIGTDELTCGSDKNWVEALPRCEILACGSPAKVQNAVLKGESFNLGDVVNYECKAGYDLVGNSLLTCGPNNQWLGTYPVCVKVDCGQPVTLPDSYLDVDGTDFQSTATIDCIDGYQLQGREIITCGADRQWIFDPSSVCLPLDCGSPPEIPNGSRLPDRTTFGSLAVYTCNAGHVMEGTSSMYCDSDGQWGYELPVCAPVSCTSDIPSISHATFITTGVSYGDIAEFTCHKGYTFQDPSASTLTCGDMGNWKGDVSDCVVIDCGLPPQFEYAYSSYNLTTYSSIVYFYCIMGYESDASKIFTCSDSGKWEGVEVVCNKKDCQNYPELSNGEYAQGGGTLYKDEVLYTCDIGYAKKGPDVITCMSDGVWTLPYCAAVDCQDPPEVDHGHFQMDSTTFESEAKYQCDAGYVLAGKSTIECLETGIWTPTQALCKPLNCREPPSVQHAEVEVNTTLFQGVAAYTCEVGFTTTTPIGLTCGDAGNWVGIVPKCEIITCPQPEASQYSYVEFKGLEYSSIADYGCDAGYTLKGQDRRVCLQNGTWSHDVPTCTAFECSEPENIPNGKVTVTGLSFGGLAYFSCLEGYSLQGHDSIMCDENGSWNSSFPKCLIVDCKTPSLIPHAYATFATTTYLSKASYTCTKGYSLIGDMESICQSNGQWSKDEKTECQLITCPQPPLLDNGSLVSYNETFGSRAVYRCLPGYKPQTVTVLTCDESSSWHGNLPSCSEKLCPDPESIDNGRFRYDGERTVGTVVSYSCDIGYNLIGPTTITCTNEEIWSSIPPYCKPVKCPSLTEIPFSILVQEENSLFMSIATFRCQEGYQMANQNDPNSDEAVYMCGPTGRWDGDEFKCTPITCPLYPPVVENALYELTNGNMFGSIAAYKCQIGYAMHGTNDFVCNKNGEWVSEHLPVCSIVSCALPPDVEGAHYDAKIFTYGSIVSYSCYKNHRLVGDNSIHCRSDGAWTPVTFNCDPIMCTDLSVPDNGKILNAIDWPYLVGFVVNYACNDGFALIGAGSVTCLESGLWDLPSPWCQKIIGACEESIPMENAVATPPGRFPGDEILVECRDGYVGIGDMFSKCLVDGSWQIPPGHCGRLSCGRPDSYDRRNVRVFGRSFLYGDSVRYMCRYGYSPVHNPPVLKCLSSGQWDNNASCIAQCKQKCENGGRCLGLNRCKCMPGWAGFKCHTPICIFPCLNGGRCEGPYQCRCPQGYHGSRCERAICPRMCQNGGRCLRPGKCTCLPGYQGSVCEDRVLDGREKHSLSN